MTNGNDASAPVIEGSNTYVRQTGLTKREYFAAAALQGMLANAWKSDLKPEPGADLLLASSRHAVRIADALIAALNEGGE